MRKKPEILATEVKASTTRFKIETVHLRFSNGEERHFERMRGSGRGAVLMVAIDEENNFLLVREYAVGVERYELGFPKGLIDPNETPLEAANRELKEELGVGAHDLQLLQSMTMSPGYLTSVSHVILARDLYPESLPGDEPEPLEIVKWPVKDYKKLLCQSDFTEARSIAALFLAKESC